MKWFRRKKKPSDYPDFWQKYLTNFEKKVPEEINKIRFVVFDTETTGFDFEHDRILSIGAVSVKSNSIEIKDNLEIYLDQDTFNPETVKIHGIIKNEKIEKFSELEAIKEFLAYIQDSVLVAHHAGFDIKMMNKALLRNGLPKLKNKVLDTSNLYKRSRIATNLIDKNKVYSLDEIAEDFNIDITDRHTASGDAYITALAFMKLLSRLNKEKNLNLKKLYRL